MQKPKGWREAAGGGAYNSKPTAARKTNRPQPNARGATKVVGKTRCELENGASGVKIATFSQGKIKGRLG